MAKLNKQIATILATKIRDKCDETFRSECTRILEDIQLAYGGKLTTLMEKRLRLDDEIDAMALEAETNHHTEDYSIGIYTSRGNKTPDISVSHNRWCQFDELVDKLLLDDYFSGGELSLDDILNKYSQELIAEFNNKDN